ncbi:ERF family protein [Citrobacter portucalensis]|uniref:ERF family protein n=1 Tax=Citrobacter portucalensis TaxID=1639133 RepID=UPI002243D8C9|nr:ERF family protein [Citrobacter portucalensis]MCW8351659.1 ERF family protein [Citrobacter portucalensis]MCX9043486.1 ERF family protein [Citrobacter portucalensis]
MSTLLSIPDAAELLAHTLTALKAAGYASAAMMPVHNNASNQGEKKEVQPATAPEVYVAPGKQYANARDALAHMVHELKNPARDNYNETLDFTYATLAQLLDMLRDPIYQHGLMLNQELVHADNATDSLPFNMVTTFHHNPTGTEVSFTLPAYLRQDKRLDACQQFGATYTYYRRYGLRQALDITDGDDDIDQASRKQERRKARTLNTSREWKPTTSARTKPEAILNMLVASGEFTGAAAIAQAKARNPFLRTPAEVAEDTITRLDGLKSDAEQARDIVLRYGLTDVHWQGFYQDAGQFRVDGDDLIDTSTGQHVSAETAMDIAESLTTVALSTADNSSVHDSSDRIAPPRTFIPDCSPLSEEEEAFVLAVESGHDDEIMDIAMRLMESHVNAGLNMREVQNDTSYHRRNWYNACREFYTLSLMAGNVNLDVLSNPDMTIARNLTDIVGADGDDEASEQTIMAAMSAKATETEQMTNQAAVAIDIARGNDSTDTKLKRLNEISRCCDAHTAKYVDTLILCLETDELTREFPVYVSESDLPY